MNYVGRSPGIVLVGDVNPVGAIGWFHGVPNNTYLQLNGQAVAKAAYPDLWTYAQAFLTANQAVNPGLFRDVDATNFALPNLAGLFVRAPGGNAAGLGVLQADGIAAHTHAGVPGAALNAQGGANAIGNNQSGNTFNNNGAAAETRPINVALIPCIKAIPAYVVPPFVSSGPMKMTVFTASGNFNKSPGVKRIEVTVVGGGASGGGSFATGASQVSCGGGGGGGGTAIKVIDAALLAASEVVTVGVGGAAVASANGNNGGNSQFGAHCTANGGNAAQGSAAGATCGAHGGPGGTAIGGDLNIQGGGGMTGVIASFSVQGGGGAGGSSSMGGGARAKLFNNGAGDAGGLYGGGGAGAAGGQSVAALAGGAGANGVVIVKEYF